MNYTTIVHRGTSYQCREIPDQENGKLIVAPVTLLDSLYTFAIKGEFHGEEKAVDQQVCFYASAEEYKLGDRELLNLIYS